MEEENKKTRISRSSHKPNSEHVEQNKRSQGENITIPNTGSPKDINNKTKHNKDS